MTDPLNVQPPRAREILSQAQQDTVNREEVARKNREALLQLVAEKDLWIRKEDFDEWRPTVRVEGEIQGVKAGLTIIATDGNVAYFDDANDFDVFFGHIQMFSGEVRTLYAMPKEGLIKEAKDKPKKEKKHVRDAMELLEKLQARPAKGATPR